MNHLKILAALVAIVAVMSAPLADAKGRKNGEQAEDVVQNQAREITDRAKTEEKKAKQQVKKRKDKARDAKGNESGDDSESDDSDSDDSESDDSESDDSDHDNAHDAIDEGDRAAKGMDNAANRGSEKSQEMRTRRDERKAIKEEYKAGDNGEMINADGTADSLDADNETESNEKKEKKPWWKFWDQ